VPQAEVHRVVRQAYLQSETSDSEVAVAKEYRLVDLMNEERQAIPVLGCEERAKPTMNQP
jgi:hypothetical protein